MSLTVFGFGSVGQALAKQAVQSGIKVLAVADSSGAVMSKSECFNFKKLSQLSSFKNSQNKLIDWNCSASEQVIPTDIFCDRLPLDSMVADCSATKQSTDHLKQCQTRGIPVTLANKKPLTQSMADFAFLTQDRSLIRFETTVCAGLPIITSVGRILDSGDTISEIQGQFSGTIGYMLSELHPNTRMSEIVQKAKAAHYTEPDPREDLNGMDIARKALILARCMGMDLEMRDVEIEPLYPSEMDELSAAEFMQNLTALDENMAKKVLHAVERGNRLRYTAKVDAKQQSVKVGLHEVPQSDALYNLVGTDCLVSIKTEWYQSPMVIHGPGAGEEIAAGALLSDMYELKGIKKQWGAQRKSF